MADDATLKPGSAGSDASADDLKKQTARIPLDLARLPGAGGESRKTTGPIPQTIRLKRPPTAPVTLRPDDALGAGPSSKRATARIVIESPSAAKSPTERKHITGPVPGIPTLGGPIPQTIRLKRPPTAPVGVMAPLRAAPPPSEAPTIARQAPPVKPATTRIPLAATETPPPPAEAPPAAAPQPRTIRLKRPATVAGLDETVGPATPETTVEAARKSETSKIELPPDLGVAAPITQRKTIKIKRTEGPAAPRTVAVERPAAKPAADQEPAAAPAGPVAEEPAHDLASAILSLAAMLCVAALVYVMVVQATGVQWPMPASLMVQ